ncbi:NAD(+) diphosphatase [Candidatus Lokiarchaeum ossiferum]|uniref:NAD(+) diphosphatase n=1 Tax=Candidatus Lokiarchaeum ossiferum TaxID=2951803 RepID=UPI00352EB26B
MVKDFNLCSKMLSFEHLTALERTGTIFLFQNNNILALKQDNGSRIPLFFIKTNSKEWKNEIIPQIEQISHLNWKCIQFGEYLNEPVYMIYFSKETNFKIMEGSGSDNSNYYLKNYPIRYLIRLEPGFNLLIAGIAFHIYTWITNHKYCGVCGVKTIASPSEFALKCPDCSHVEYPLISPAVIIAITKGDKILLAHNNQFPPNLYSVVAGFVNPGETLEEAVAREVKEEIGITIKNITYFESQPWPFPNSLMLAFTAEWSEGEIKVDHNEIHDAKWFKCDEFPQLPSSISVARKLIDHFVSTQSSKPQK